MSANWGNSENIYSLGVLPPVTQSRLPTSLRARSTRQTKSARDFIPSLVDLFITGRMPLDRFIARYDFDDFNLAAADAISGAAIKPLVLLP